MSEGILTETQAARLRERFEDSARWRDESELTRVRALGQRLKSLIDESGVCQGDTLERQQLTEMVELQWESHNLNPGVVKRCLGPYAYAVHFAAFQGSEDEFAVRWKEQNDSPDVPDGVTLQAASEAIALIASASQEEQLRGAARLFATDTVNEALVSGFLYLLYPDRYGLVRPISRIPFSPGGWLDVTAAQRAKAKTKAASQLPSGKEFPPSVIRKWFHWQVLLEEVFELGHFEDYCELEQFLWYQTTAPEPNAEDRIVAAVKAADRQKDLATRQEAESAARNLIERHLGRLTSDHFSQLFTLLNTCVGKKGPVFTRFGPAFVGHNARQMMEYADELNRWIEHLWHADDSEVSSLLTGLWEEKFAGVGRAFPSAIMYLRDPETYAIWTNNLDKALYSVLPGQPAAFRTGIRYLQFCRGVQSLRQKHAIPAEMHDFVLFSLMKNKPLPDESGFGGFTADAFQFLADLREHNNTEWFDQNRGRYEQALREPLKRMMQDLGAEAIPSFKLALETSPQKCLSRINRNTYGRSNEAPYHDVFWAAFHRKGQNKTTDVQLFVSLESDSLYCGLSFPADAGQLQRRLAKSLGNAPEQLNRVFAQLTKAGFEFACDDSESSSGEPVEIATPDAFLKILSSGPCDIIRRMPAETVVSWGRKLKQVVVNDFKTLVPLFRMATGEGPDTPKRRLITITDLMEATHLGEEFFVDLDRFLSDKRQLIFVGPPGTSKTFVAKQYAEYLAQNGGEVRVVQFHPSYAYEDFVEGLRPVATDGGALTYRIEDGIFKRLCNAAIRNTGATYVLLIDEINRGNIPRIFGELLYLLENRGSEVDLPYSKESFSIPENVIVLGTMNSSDRSIALMDLALRRRFHFQEMLPEGDVLLSWLSANNRPVGIRRVFEHLNQRLERAGVDEDRLIGHAHFMSGQRDVEFLDLVWKGTVIPLLKEYFFAEPKKLDEFAYEKFRYLLEEEDSTDDSVGEEDAELGEGEVDSDGELPDSEGDDADGGN